MPTISGGTAGSTTPLLILPWRTTQVSGNVFYDVLSAPFPLVTLQAAGWRRGELRCFYQVEALAEAARNLLSQPRVFTITYPERPTLQFKFAVEDTIAVALDDETSEHWMLTFGYREVLF
jgi:hypothetical protein